LDDFETHDTRASAGIAFASQAPGDFGYVEPNAVMAAGPRVYTPAQEIIRLHCALPGRAISRYRATNWGRYQPAGRQSHYRARVWPDLRIISVMYSRLSPQRAFKRQAASQQVVTS
jgi:hypothetical protein